MRWPVVLCTIGLTVVACSPPFPPVGITSTDGPPSVLWKFCDTDLGINSVVVSRVTDDEPEAWPQVWSAVRDSRATALAEVPIDDTVPGYTVETDEGWPLEPNATYAVTDAVDSRGGNALGVVLEFQLAELRSGKVVSPEKNGLDLKSWLGRGGPACQ
jgi:hypothetical protein